LRLACRHLPCNREPGPCRTSTCDHRHRAAPGGADVTIDTPTGTVIRVTKIRAIPKATPWQPERLADATRAADRVILGARPRISPGDILRLMFSGGKLTRLPGKAVARENTSRPIKRPPLCAAAYPPCLASEIIAHALGGARPG